MAAQLPSANPGQRHHPRRSPSMGEWAPEFRDVKVTQSQVVFNFIDDRQVAIPIRQWPMLDEADDHTRMQVEFSRNRLIARWPDLGISVRAEDLNSTDPRRTFRPQWVNTRPIEVTLGDISMPSKGDLEREGLDAGVPHYPSALPTSRQDAVIAEQAAILLLQLHPIMVRSVRGEWKCSAGRQTFAIARSCLPPETSIVVQEVRAGRHETVQHLQFADQVLTPILYSPGKQRNQWFQRLREAILAHPVNRRIASHLMPAILRAGTYARLLGVSPVLMKSSSRHTSREDDADE